MNTLLRLIHTSDNNCKKTCWFIVAHYTHRRLNFYEQGEAGSYRKNSWSLQQSKRSAMTFALIQHVTISQSNMVFFGKTMRFVPQRLKKLKKQCVSSNVNWLVVIGRRQNSIWTFCNRNQWYRYIQFAKHRVYVPKLWSSPIQNNEIRILPLIMFKTPL